MPAVFHSLGNLPFDNERVNNLASGSAMLSAVALTAFKHKCSDVVWTTGFVSIQCIDEMKDFIRGNCQITK